MAAEIQAVDRWDQREMVDTLKQTVCRGATDAQFRMFIEVCKATGLNPWLKEIWYVPSVGVMAGRDGYLRIANEHPMFDGMETRIERDDHNIPIKAVCSVWRKDRSHPTVCEAFYNEYKKATGVWQTYPSAMISKVAEVLALKRSFSINGIVTEEEIGEQDPRGSREAAEAVRDEKLRLIRETKALSAPAIQEIEQREAAKQSEASEVIAEASKPKPSHKRGQVAFDALKFMGDMKKALRETTGDDLKYYAILQENGGYAHADEIATTDEARYIYKIMEKENTRLRNDKVLLDTLKRCEQKIGRSRFLEVLGANGAGNEDEALQLTGSAVTTLLHELQLAVDGV